MDINDILAQAGGLGSIARELGVSESEAARGSAALLPALLGGFKKQAQSGGLEGLGGLLGQLGGGSLFDDVLSPQPTDVNRGNDVLGQIFGSKDVSRTVAKNAAAQSGLDPGLLRKMLPMLAMLVAGFMARQRGGGAAAPPSAPSGGGGLGGGLGDLLGGLGGLFGGGGQDQDQDQVGRAPGATAGGGGALGGLASMLDLNKDGNPLDDILRMAGKAMR